MGAATQHNMNERSIQQAQNELAARERIATRQQNFQLYSSVLSKIGDKQSLPRVMAMLASFTGEPNVHSFVREGDPYDPMFSKQVDADVMRAEAMQKQAQAAIKQVTVADDRLNMDIKLANRSHRKAYIDRLLGNWKVVLSATLQAQGNRLEAFRQLAGALKVSKKEGGGTTEKGTGRKTTSQRIGGTKRGGSSGSSTQTQMNEQQLTDVLTKGLTSMVDVGSIVASAAMAISERPWAGPDMNARGIQDMIRQVIKQQIMLQGELNRAPISR